MSAGLKYSPAKRANPVSDADDDSFQTPKGRGRKTGGGGGETTAWVCPEEGCGAPLLKRFSKKGTSSFVACSEGNWLDPTSCGFTASLFRPDSRSPHLCKVCLRDVGGYPSVGRPTDDVDKVGNPVWENFHACFDHWVGRKASAKFPLCTRANAGQANAFCADYDAKSPPCTDLRQGCTGKIAEGDLIVKGWTERPLHARCGKRMHQSAIVAAIFLGLYGIGLPLAVLAVVYWASDSTNVDDGCKSSGNTNNNDNNDDNNNSSHGDGGLLAPTAALGGGSPTGPSLPLRTLSDAAAATSSATLSGEEGEDGPDGGAATAVVVASVGTVAPPAAAAIETAAAAGRRGRHGGGAPQRHLSVGLSHDDSSSMSQTSDEKETVMRDGSSRRSVVFDGGTGNPRVGGDSLSGNNPSSAAAVDMSPRSTLGWGESMAESSTTTATTNTTLTTQNTRGWDRCLRRTWERSGRLVLALRRAMSSKADPWMLSQTDSVRRLGARWRSTIPLWSPYRGSRHWFAAWDLARRSLLTGLLTLVPDEVGGREYLRVTVACALSGVALAIGEAARPHRDPWIGWVYRVGGVMIFLENLLGLLQKVWSADTQSTHVQAFAAIFVTLIPVMILCVCGGWRLSCAEQRTITAADASSPSSSSLALRTQRQAGGKDRGPKLRGRSFPINSTTAAAVAADAGDDRRKGGNDAPRKMVPDFDRRGVDAPGAMPGDKNCSRGETAGACSKPRKTRSPPYFKQLAGGGGGGGGLAGGSRRGGRSSKDGDNSSSANKIRSPETPEPSGKEQSTYVQNPIFYSGSDAAPRKIPWSLSAAQIAAGGGASGPEPGGGGASGGETSGAGYRSKRTSTFDRYMLSRSPRTSSGGGIAGGFTVGRFGGGFNSISGDGSATIRASIDAHRNFSGKPFGSNGGGGGGGGGASLPVDGFNSNPPDAAAAVAVDTPSSRTTGTSPITMTSHTRSRSSSLDGSFGGLGVGGVAGINGRGFINGGGIAVQGGGGLDARSSSVARTAPLLAPGAPVIDGRHFRFDRKGRGESSGTSSFASTSFESGKSGDRDRKGVAGRTTWRRSAGSRYFAGRSFGAHSRGSSIGGGDSGIGFSKGKSFGRSSTSTGSGSIMSPGASSVSSRASSALVPPPMLPPLHSQANTGGDKEFGLVASSSNQQGEAVVVGNSENLGSDWAPTRTARGGWPLDLPPSSAMPAWFTQCTAINGGDPNAGAPADLVAAAAERMAAAEREAAAARVEAVFGDGNLGDRRFSNVEGGSNIVDFRAFVRAGGLGTSSFDSRASDSRHGASTHGSDGGDEDVSQGGRRDGSDSDATPRRGGSRGYGLGVSRPEGWVGDKGVFRAEIPLTSAELKHQFDFDFEDDGELEEDPVSFVRVSDRVNTINAKLVGGARARGGRPIRFYSQV